MPKPKPRRCGTCGVVTSRYARTERVGALVIKVWVRDESVGEVSTMNGTVIRCRAHADTAR
jgi:hypothetical protein